MVYIELLIVIKGENSNKENFIKDIEEKDMNNWIKESNIDINNEKLYHKNDIYFKIINKTIISHKKKYFMKNDIKEREEEILNNQRNYISPNLQELLKKTMIFNFKSIKKKNNGINNIINNGINDKKKIDNKKHELSETMSKNNSANINYFNQKNESSNNINMTNDYIVCKIYSNNENFKNSIFING